MTSHKIFTRIAEALERLAPPDKIDLPDLSAHSVYLWQADKQRLQPVENPHCVPLDLLVGIASLRVIFCARIPSNLPAQCPPITPCFGGRGEWANLRS